MTLSKMEYDEQQSRLWERDEAHHHGHNDCPPPEGMKYVLKRSDLLPKFWTNDGDFFSETSIHDMHVFSMKEEEAMRFNSATDARDHATAHSISGVWVVLAKDQS
jgi:hypothetical protein